MTRAQIDSARQVAAGLLRQAMADERDSGRIDRVVELRRRAKDLLREADETEAAMAARKGADRRMTTAHVAILEDRHTGSGS